MGSVELLQGDCLVRMQEIPDGSVDMILTDPPYGTTACKWDTVIDLPRMWKEVWRITKPNGIVLMTAQTPFDKVLGFSDIKNLKYEWIWHKTEATGFLNAKKSPLKAHENILVFYRKAPKYNPEMTFGHEIKRSRKASDKSQVYGRQDKPTEYSSTTRYPRSVQTFSTDKRKHNYHPTQKPVALMEYLIKTYSDKGDLIVDFTMGSGTTGVACVNTDRKFIGIELDNVYFEIAKKRIHEATLNHPSKQGDMF